MSTNKIEHQNRLAETTSPYLQQHAGNPVDWHPWDETALNSAREQDKPILLSIGYSACHWCHVMAHESFEDEETAALMNDLFVNIKVDREERPDLDRIYQTAHQLMTQRPGGWPLTAFLSPQDHTPFFIGTYFPDRQRHGLPSFADVLRNLAGAYREHQVEIMQQNKAVLVALARLNPDPGSQRAILESTPLEQARQQLTASFDRNHGGFGQPPKFPHPSSISFLLRQWATAKSKQQSDEDSLYIPQFTLRCMAEGGINDQLGGGFCRYSVDGQWMIPHFEKMLYDNGQLLALYADIWQVTESSFFRETTVRTAEWVIREMQDPAGGYYSALDADSNGEEGLFYIWTREEVRSLLSAAEFEPFSRYYGLDHDPNFEGRWHLHTRTSLTRLSEMLGLSDATIQGRIESARRKLYQARERRTRPGLDDKILTAWNALMIKGMARAGRVLNEPKYIESAERSLRFIRQQMWRQGRLLAAHKDGVSHLPAYLDDHAFLIDALLELIQARWNSEDLEFAIELAELLLSKFQDNEAGGFFFTADDHEKLIHRPKPYSDDATPSGNGIAASTLSRLGHLLGEPRFLEAAERTLGNAREEIKRVPHAFCTLLEALEEQLSPPEMIIIRGSGESLEQWRRNASGCFAPGRFIVAIPEDERQLPGLLEQRKAEDKTLAYICQGTQCKAPIRSLDEF